MNAGNGGQKGGKGELRVAHHHPGRLRLRSPALSGHDPEPRAARDRAAHAMNGLPGIRDVATNAHTGSVLVVYDPARVGPDALVDAAAQAAGLTIAEPRPHPGDEDHVVDVVIDAFRGLNGFASELTGHRVDLRVLVPAALAGAGVFSFAAGEEPRLPRWDTLLYWAYAVFSAVNQREIDQRTEERRTP